MDNRLLKLQVHGSLLEICEMEKVVFVIQRPTHENISERVDNNA